MNLSDAFLHFERMQSNRFRSLPEWSSPTQNNFNVKPGKRFFSFFKIRVSIFLNFKFLSGCTFYLFALLLSDLEYQVLESQCPRKEHWTQSVQDPADQVYWKELVHRVLTRKEKLNCTEALGWLKGLGMRVKSAVPWLLVDPVVVSRYSSWSWAIKRPIE